MSNADAPTPETDALRNEIEGGRFVSWLEVLPAFWRVFDKMAVIERQRDAAMAKNRVLRESLSRKGKSIFPEIVELRNRAESAESQLAALAEKCRGMEEGFKWLEDNSTLHKRVEILYVVDGYEVTVMHEDGVTEITKPYRGETLMDAIQAARKESRHE